MVGMVFDREALLPVGRIVCDRQAQGAQNGHGALGRVIEILAQTVLQKAELDRGGRL